MQTTTRLDSNSLFQLLGYKDALNDSSSPALGDMPPTDGEVRLSLKHILKSKIIRAFGTKKQNIETNATY